MELITDKQRFLEAFRARSEQLADGVQSGDRNMAWASLELLASVFSVFNAEEPIDCDELKSAYPVKDWRERQAIIPLAFLEPLVEAWASYKQDGDKRTLGEVLGLEGGGQGKTPIAALEQIKDRHRKLSNLVVVDIVWQSLQGQPITQDAAFQGVADSEGVSLETVQKAFRKHGPKSIKALKDLGVFASGSEYPSD